MKMYDNGDYAAAEIWWCMAYVVNMMMMIMYDADDDADAEADDV